jgi:hypothetical protein
MHTTECAENEYELAARRAAASPTEQQRRLGWVYRLILNYGPKRKAVVQGEVGKSASQTDDAQSAVG